MPSYRVAAGGGLNIRSGPGTGYPVETAFPVDEILESPDTTGWLPIALEEELEDGTKKLYTGWGSEKFLMRFEGPVTPPPDTGEPLWLIIARQELGVSEISGSRHNRRVVEYHQTTTLRATDDETPWCSSFVNWCIIKAGLKGTNSAAAISWASWGIAVPLTQGKPGDVAVFTRTGGNHVGFYLKHDANALTILGGNQGDEVNIATFSRARVMGLRRPA